MKIIPYLRFIWAGFIVINLFTQTDFTFDFSDTFNIFFKVIGGLFGLTFASYCIVTGLQEIKNKQLIDARFFEYFGLLVEILIFVGGLYLLVILLRQQSDLWRTGLIFLWQLGLLTLLIVDIKRIRAS